MTIQQKRDFIRQKAIACNPEIVELKFGCRLHHPDYRTAHIYDVSPTGHGNGKKFFTDLGHGFYDETIKDGHIRRNSLDEPDMWKIIGRPVRLADVLNALMHTEHTVCIASNERFELFNKAKNEWEQQFKTWYLVQDNLESQSEPTIDFIYSLLK